MAYIKKDFFIETPVKAWSFLVSNFSFSMREAQRVIDRAQLLQNDEVVKTKSQIINGKISLLTYEPNPKGLKPIFENEDFALFEKPSGVLSHPKNRNTEYSLNDEIKSLFGKDANVVHRLDRETSGLIVVSKHKGVENELKTLFESRAVTKKYVALVRGKVDEEFLIDEPILVNADFSLIKLKVYIDKNGKNSQTYIKPIKYFDDIDATLIETTPKTGRQHQIRVHMFHMKHCIIGDPIYGQSLEDGAKFLDGLMSEEERVHLTNSSRLLLHANSISFNFKSNEYNFKSEYNAEYEFKKLVKGAKNE
ncbi:MAG: RluA family pseudouridine synthase [Campylobacteraceae bacterium]